jgi:hypothetical protein
MLNDKLETLLNNNQKVVDLYDQYPARSGYNEGYHDGLRFIIMQIQLLLNAD